MPTSAARSAVSVRKTTSRKKAASPAKMADVALIYNPSLGIDAYLEQMHEATPLQIMEIERKGIAGVFITDLSRRMDIPASKVFTMLRIPKATALRKAAGDALIDGRAGQAAVGMVRLLNLAQEIVRDSTSPEAADFDTVKWLGQWIERPQAALGGRKPAEFLDTPTGVAIVSKVLGAMRSGAYL